VLRETFGFQHTHHDFHHGRIPAEEATGVGGCGQEAGQAFASEPPEGLLQAETNKLRPGQQVQAVIKASAIQVIPIEA
jgi:hypothetical protein